VDEIVILEAALLHDTIEDAECSWEDLHRHFSPKTVGYVREVTNDKTLSQAERKRLQVEHAKTASLGARLIKMSDKLYNLPSPFQSPPTWWDPKRIQGYFVWSKAMTDAGYGNKEGPQTGGKLSPGSRSGYVSPPTGMPSTPSTMDSLSLTVSRFQMM
jgi:guanosine-3',5'-bis(diphosphate) 3'-pyrophosphohydrolase